MLNLETLQNHASLGRMTETPHSGKTVICEEMLNFIHNDVSYFQQDSGNHYLYLMLNLIHSDVFYF